MVRSIAGAIAGYLAMAIFIIVTFAAAFPLLGIDRLFAPGSYDASMFWIALSFGLGLVGAVIGGGVAASVGRSPRAVHILAGLVLIFGVASAVAGVNDATRGGTRPEGATMTDAMSFARQPVWVMVVNPLVGVAGVLLGARKRT